MLVSLRSWQNMKLLSLKFVGSLVGVLCLLYAVRLKMRPNPVEMTLVGIDHEYDQVYSYRFTSEQNLTWKAGQYVHLVAPNSTISRVMVRHMSIATTAAEDEIMFSMDVSSQSPYKQQWSAVQVGDPVNFFKIDGKFLLTPEVLSLLTFTSVNILHMVNQITAPCGVLIACTIG